VLAACQLVPVPTSSTRRPRSRPAAWATPAVSASIRRSSAGWDMIVSRITLATTGF